MTFRALALGLLLSSSTSFAFAQKSMPLLNSPKATQQFYAASKSQQIWSDDTNYTALLNALETLSAHGLNPADYHIDALKGMSTPSADRDQLATDAWFSAAAHMLYGKLNPTSVEPDWTAARREANLPEILQNALSEKTIATSFEALAPTQPSYRALKSELAALRAEAAKPQTLISAGEVLKPNMTSSRVIELKRRLIELEYLAVSDLTNVMDNDTVDTVKAFQNAVNLDADGAVGPATLSALNRGLDGKLNQVLVNMERWRWLPNDLGKRHLRANIAGFDVTTWNDGVKERTHLTIVGKTFRKTPVFSDRVQYLVFNPWWETPNSLATRDKLPTFRKDPSAVERLGFQILDRQGGVVQSTSIDWNAVSPSNFPYRIRQRPGDLNALGQVKIMFPNKHNVYLHDTPTKGLFAQRQRAFSSGCLRTENPLDLSAWLLSDTADWTRSRIDNVVGTGKETRATLKQSIPVHILYFTIENEGDYGVRYLDDIYDRDAKVLAGLKTKPRSN